MPAVPGAVVGLVMIGAEEAGATVMVRAWVSLPALFVALRATTEMPAVVGVPLIAPVRELRVRPAGRPVAV